MEQMKKKMEIPPPIAMAKFDLLKKQEERKQIPEIASITMKFPKE